MAARLIESWDSSTNGAHYTGKWTAMNGSVTSGAGRNGNGLRVTSVGQYVGRAFDNQQTWIVGAAFRSNNLTLGATPFVLLDGATVQTDVRLNTDGTLAVRRGGATVLGTSSLALLVSTWYYLEWKVVVAGGTSGSATLRVNGAAALTLTGVNTQQTANAYGNTVRLHDGSNVGNTDFDDVYVFDGTGATNADFAGDCKVELRLPTGAGATTAWTPSAGSNWQCVDDAPPNGDTDYVASATAGQTDTYAVADLVTTSGTVKCVQATAYFRKDDAGSRSLALVARPGSTDRVGGTVAVSDSYLMAAQLWETNPDTSAAWTIADVNGAQFGVRLVA